MTEWKKSMGMIAVISALGVFTLGGHANEVFGEQDDANFFAQGKLLTGEDKVAGNYFYQVRGDSTLVSVDLFKHMVDGGTLTVWAIDAESDKKVELGIMAGTRDVIKASFDGAASFDHILITEKIDGSESVIAGADMHYVASIRSAPGS